MTDQRSLVGGERLRATARRASRPRSPAPRDAKFSGGSPGDSLCCKPICERHIFASRFCRAGTAPGHRLPRHHGHQAPPPSALAEPSWSAGRSMDRGGGACHSLRRTGGSRRHRGGDARAAPGPADRLRRALALRRDDPPPEPAAGLICLLDERRFLPPGLRAITRRRGTNRRERQGQRSRGGSNGRHHSKHCVAAATLLGI